MSEIIDHRIDGMDVLDWYEEAKRWKLECIRLLEGREPTLDPSKPIEPKFKVGDVVEVLNGAEIEVPRDHPTPDPHWYAEMVIPPSNEISDISKRGCIKLGEDSYLYHPLWLKHVK